MEKCVLCDNLNIGKMDKYVMNVKKERNVLNVNQIYLNNHLKFVIFVNLIKIQLMMEKYFRKICPIYILYGPYNIFIFIIFIHI